MAGQSGEYGMVEIIAKKKKIKTQQGIKNVLVSKIYHLSICLGLLKMFDVFVLW